MSLVGGSLAQCGMSEVTGPVATNHTEETLMLRCDGKVGHGTIEDRLAMVGNART